MRGMRLPDGYHRNAAPGSYWKNESGIWEAVTPNGRRGVLSGHTVTEHDDGTITVSPSIQVDPVILSHLTRDGWHGYLTMGVWKEY